MNAIETHRAVDRLGARRLSRRCALRSGGAGFAAALVGAAAWRSGTAAQTVTPGADLVAPTGEAVATPAVASWDEIDRSLTLVAPQVALLGAELVNGAVHPVHGFQPDLRFGVGSSFKLYILGELGRQIAAKQTAWEDTLPIDPRYRSVPGGDLRYAPDGALYTVRYYAERMMQKSDNTATDTLLFHLGRENVEKMMTTMGNSDPSRNIPLLSTREFAILKLVYPQARLDTYLAASVAEKRQILASVIDKMPYSVFASVPEQTKPLRLDTVEWFATRMDLARAMLSLQTMAEQPGLLPVTEVMSLETQLPFDAEVWPYVGFKGGSELGLLSGTWLLHRADRRRFVLSLGFTNPNAGLDLGAATTVMEAARDQLALAP